MKSLCPCPTAITVHLSSSKWISMFGMVNNHSITFYRELGVPCFLFCLPSRGLLPIKRKRSLKRALRALQITKAVFSQWYSHLYFLIDSTRGHRKQENQLNFHLSSLGHQSNEYLQACKREYKCVFQRLWNHLPVLFLLVMRLIFFLHQSLLNMGAA